MEEKKRKERETLARLSLDDLDDQELEERELTRGQLKDLAESKQILFWSGQRQNRFTVEAQGRIPRKSKDRFKMSIDIPSPSKKATEIFEKRDGQVRANQVNKSTACQDVDMLSVTLQCIVEEEQIAEDEYLKAMGEKLENRRIAELRQRVWDPRDKRMKHARFAEDFQEAQEASIVTGRTFYDKVDIDRQARAELHQLWDRLMSWEKDMILRGEYSLGWCYTSEGRRLSRDEILELVS